MTDREYQIHSYAVWILSTITVVEILKTQNAAGHAQQLTYVMNKFFDLAIAEFGDEFRDEFHALFEKINGPTNKDQGNSSVHGETLH